MDVSELNMHEAVIFYMVYQKVDNLESALNGTNLSMQ